MRILNREAGREGRGEGRTERKVEIRRLASVGLGGVGRRRQGAHRATKIFNLRLTTPLVHKMIQESNTKSQPWGRLSTYCTRTLSPAVLRGYGYAYFASPLCVCVWCVHVCAACMLCTRITMVYNGRRTRRNAQTVGVDTAEEGNEVRSEKESNDNYNFDVLASRIASVKVEIVAR